jgi:hypothetical protein
MHLILSILAGFAGSALGAAARAGIDAAERQLRGEPQPDNVIVNASPVAAVAGGALGLILGARRAFWIAAVLSAAGSHRLDERLMGKAGIDLDGLIAKAQEAAAQARSKAGSEASAVEIGTEAEPAPQP